MKRHSAALTGVIDGAVVTAVIRNAQGDMLAEGESSWSFPRLGRIAGMAGVQEEVLQRFLQNCCPAATDT